jgi:hypothetical protein
MVFITHKINSSVLTYITHYVRVKNHILQHVEDTRYVRRHIPVTTILRRAKMKQIHKMCAHKQFLQCLADAYIINRKILQQNITNKKSNSYLLLHVAPR